MRLAARASAMPSFAPNSRDRRLSFAEKALINSSLYSHILRPASPSGWFNNHHDDFGRMIGPWRDSSLSRVPKGKKLWMGERAGMHNASKACECCSGSFAPNAHSKRTPKVGAADEKA